MYIKHLLIYLFFWIPCATAIRFRAVQLKDASGRTVTTLGDAHISNMKEQYVCTKDEVACFDLSEKSQIAALNKLIQEFEIPFYCEGSLPKDDFKDIPKKHAHLLIDMNFQDRPLLILLRSIFQWRERTKAPYTYTEMLSTALEQLLPNENLNARLATFYKKVISVESSQSKVLQERVSTLRTLFEKNPFFFSIGELCQEYVQLLDAKKDFQLQEQKIQLLANVLKLIGQDILMIDMIRNAITKNKNIIIQCGALHMNSLIPYLEEEGFKIVTEIKSNQLPKNAILTNDAVKLCALHPLSAQQIDQLIRSSATNSSCSKSTPAKS